MHSPDHIQLCSQIIKFLNIPNSNIMIFILFFLQILAIYSQQNLKSKSHQLSTFTSQEQQLDFNSYASPYQIDVKRIASTTPHEQNHCKGHPRKLTFHDDSEIFRLDTQISQRTYDQSIYLSLTSLHDQQEIVQFDSLGERFFAITNRNKIYFLKQGSNGKLQKQYEIDLPNQVRDFVTYKQFFSLSIDFAPFLLFPHMAVLCSQGHCKILQGWKQIQHITHASFMKVDSKRFILLSENEEGISIYELSQSNKLQNHQKYGKQHFNNASQISIFDISPNPQGDPIIYALDYHSGLYALSYDQSNPGNIKSFQKIIDQRNCFSMDLKSSKYVVMNCRVGKSDFLLEVYKDNSTGHYISERPIFKYQSIFDVILTNKFYASRGFHGLKFYWVNPKYPYPFEFKKAGELFVHNALQIRYKNKDNKDYLFYATPNSIRKISIIEKPSYATCISNVPTSQYPCENSPQTTCITKQSIKYEVWKHGGISVMKTLVPTLLAFIGAIVIIVLLVLLYRRYQKDQDEVSLRFANTSHQFQLQSAR